MKQELLKQMKLTAFSCAVLLVVLFSTSAVRAVSYGLSVFDYSVDGGFVIGTHETYLDYNAGVNYTARTDGYLLTYNNDETLQQYQTLDYYYAYHPYDAVFQTFGYVQRGKIYAVYSVHSVVARRTYYQYYQDPYGYSRSFADTREPSYNFTQREPAFTTYSVIPVARTIIYVGLPNIQGLNVASASTGATTQVQISGKYIGEHTLAPPDVSISGDGVTASVNRIIPGEGVVVDVQITNDAAAGERMLSLKAGLSPNKVPSNSVPFTVVRTQPQITSISPEAVVANTTAVVQFRGTFGSNPRVQVSGDGITTTYRGALPDGFEADFQIAENATRGNRQVMVTQSGMTSNPVTFRVGDRSPVITAISQQQGQMGEVLGVTITGENFGINPQIQFDGTGINSTVQAQSPNQIVVTFAIGDSTYEGVRGVKVRSLGLTGLGFSPALGNSDTSNAVPFSVLSAPKVTLPEINSVENQATREFNVITENMNGVETRLTIENPSEMAKGQASFSQNESEIVIPGGQGQQTTIIRIKGLVGSKDNDNIKLKAVYGNKSKERSFSVSWVEFLKKEDCVGFDDRETTRPNPSPTARNYLLVGPNVTRQAKARLRPGGGAGTFRLESDAPNIFTVTPATINSTSDVEISVTALGTAPTNKDFALNAVATQSGTTQAASSLPILIRKRVVRNIVQWKIIEDNDDVQDTPQGQGSPNRVASILLPGPNGNIDSVAGGDDTVALVRMLDVPREYRKGYRRLRRILTGANGLVETVTGGDDIIYIPPTSGVSSSFSYDPDEEYSPFEPVTTIGDGVPYGTCVSSGLNKKLDTNPNSDDQESTDSLGKPVINSGANGKCQTEANDDDIPSGTPTSAADLENYVNNVTWGRQANIFIDVNRTVQEVQVNFDLNRDGKIMPFGQNSNEHIALVNNTFKTGGDTINLYYTGMVYNTYTNPEGVLVTPVATSAQPGLWGVYGTNGVSVQVGGHELGHNFGADHRSTVGNPADYLGYIMYPTTQTGTQCRTGKEDWDEVQPVTP